MKSTMEILTKLQENSQKNHDEVFTRLFRYLLRPDIYFIAYQHLYSNKGAGTKGINDDTADGFSEQYVTAIIEALRTGAYEPKPVRRTYIQKKNGKLRPLGLPVFADKLVQEAIRMILEAIYEPIFSIYSHGFRPGKSCHTALAMIKHEFTGAKWFIEGDIKGCFDNIDHTTLIDVLNRKIKDARFLNLIRMFLKSGYMEDWNFHETYSGCPQGGIISPILANIYLNELDRYITQLKKEFDHGYNPRNFTEEYNTIRRKRDALHEKIKKAEGIMREQLIAQHKQLTKQLFRTPAKECTDKRLKYVRYADDFLIAVNGTREECEEIKAKLTDFVRDTLKMELSQEKTLITHSNTPARFLGFDVRVRRDSSVKRSGKRKMRTMNNKVELNIPLKDKVETYLLSHSIARRDGKRLIPIHRPILLNRTDLEIVMIYNAELRGLCNYYLINGDKFLHLRENDAGVGFATYDSATGAPLESGQISKQNLPPDGRNAIPAARNWFLFELSDDDRKAAQEVSLLHLDTIPQSGVRRRRIWDDPTIPGDDVRLINSHYDDLYRVPNHSVIQIDRSDGSSYTARVEHLDDYHFDLGEYGNVYHIAQFGEMMERNSASCYSEIQTSDDQGAWELGGKGYIAIQRCDDGWDYTLYHSDFSVMDGGQLDEPELTIQEVREEILENYHMEKGRRKEQDYDLIMDKAADAEELGLDSRPSTLEKLAELASGKSAPKPSVHSEPEL